MHLPDSFKEIATPLPPMLLEMAGVSVDSRFVGLYYWGNKAMWSDGRSSATFPFYTVWQPYTEHLAVALDLFGCNLGSDDVPAEQVLLCDRIQQTVYIAPFAIAMKFVDNQHPPRQKITPEQWEAIKAQLKEQQLPTMSQMQALGMFELFAPNPQHQSKALKLIDWLDRYVDQALINKYVEAAKAGNREAAWRLEMFSRM